MKFIEEVLTVVLAVLIPSVILHFGLNMLLGININIYGLSLTLLAIVAIKNLLIRRDEQ